MKTEYITTILLLLQLARFDTSLSTLRRKSRQVLPKGVGPLYLRELSPDKGLSKRRREEDEQKKAEDERCLLELSPILAPPRLATKLKRRREGMAVQPPAKPEVGGQGFLRASATPTETQRAKVGCMPLITSTPAKEPTAGPSSADKRSVPIIPKLLLSTRPGELSVKGERAKVEGREKVEKELSSAPVAEQLRIRLANVLTTQDLENLLNEAAAVLRKEKSTSCPFCDAKPEGYFKASNRDVHMRTSCRMVKTIQQNLDDHKGCMEADMAQSWPVPSTSKLPGSGRNTPDPTKFNIAEEEEHSTDVDELPDITAAAVESAANEMQRNATTAERYTRALEKLFTGRDVPEFLSGWTPGQLLSHEAMKEILFDEEFHALYMAMAREILAEVNTISKRRFTTDSFAQSYDSEHTSASLAKGQIQWSRVCRDTAHAHPGAEDFKSEMPKGTAKGKAQGLLETLKGLDPTTVYDTPKSEDEMRQRFLLFLRCKTARGKTDQLSPCTIAAYARSMFSTTSSNSLSSYVLANYGKKDGSDLTSFLFHLDRPTMVLDLGILSHFFPNDERYRAYRKGETESTGDDGDDDRRFEQRKTASLFLQSASGLISLLDYMIGHAGQTKIEPDNVNGQNRRNDYVQRVSALRSEVSKKVSQLHKASAKESKTNRLTKDLTNPESTQERLKAYRRYFREAHYNGSLMAIRKSLAAMRKKGTKGSAAVASAISQLEFKRHGFWLMINASFFNGHRPQVVQLMTNRDFTQRTTVQPTTGGAKGTAAERPMQAADVIFTRDHVLGTETMVSIPLGVSDNRNVGKTGEAEVSLPPDLATGLINYSMMKDLMEGSAARNKLTLPNDCFFVDANGKPLSLEHARTSRTGEEMAREMGIDRLPTFTEQRRVMASKMISSGATGNTGMAHTPAVQRVIYDDLQRERGVANKKMANRSLLAKPLDAETFPGSRDSSFGRAVAEKCKTDAEAAVAELRRDAKEKMFQQFLSLVQLRGPRRTILSRERYVFLQAVYSMISPEFSATILLSQPYPGDTDRGMGRRFHRFLCTNGEGMSVVRDNCASILHHLGTVDLGRPKAFELFLKLASTWHSSLLSLDMSRVNRSPRLHTLFSFPKVEQKLKLIKPTEPVAEAKAPKPASTAVTAKVATTKEAKAPPRIHTLFSFPKVEQKLKLIKPTKPVAEAKAPKPASTAVTAKAATTKEAKAPKPKSTAVTAKAAETKEEKTDTEESWPMSPPSLHPMPLTPPMKVEADMWPEMDMFESKELLDLLSGKFSPDTLSPLPLGQGKGSSTEGGGSSDDDDDETAPTVKVPSSPRKRTHEESFCAPPLDDTDPSWYYTSGVPPEIEETIEGEGENRD